MRNNIHKENKTYSTSASKTRARIIKAARKVFVAKGFNGSSMRDIANQAKVTQSLLHHHFGNKKALWQLVKHELLNQYFQDIERQLEQNEHDGRELGLEATIEYRFRFMQNNPDVVRMSLWQRLDNFQSASTRHGKSLLKVLIADIAKAQQKGELSKDIEAEMLVVIIFILTSGWFAQEYQWVLEQSDKPRNKRQDTEDYLEAIKKILARGIAPTRD